MAGATAEAIRPNMRDDTTSRGIRVLLIDGAPSISGCVVRCLPFCATCLRGVFPHPHTPRLCQIAPDRDGCRPDRGRGRSTAPRELDVVRLGPADWPSQSRAVPERANLLTTQPPPRRVRIGGVGRGWI